jgi:large subunit ribosomal protein L28
MAQVCDICGKGPQFGNNISHAHNVSRRRWNVNLQAVKALVNGASKRIRVCTSCIKAGCAGPGERPRGVFCEEMLPRCEERKILSLPGNKTCLAHVSIVT